MVYFPNAFLVDFSVVPLFLYLCLFICKMELITLP